MSETPETPDTGGFFRPPTCENCGALLPRGTHTGVPCPSCGRPRPGSTPEPELELVPALELVQAELPALVLRDFHFSLRPQYGASGEVRGVALDVVSKVGLPLQLTMMFDRSEFVNLATTGLAGLDASDAGDAGPSE